MAHFTFFHFTIAYCFLEISYAIQALSNVIDLSSLDGNDGFIVNGVPDQNVFIGWSVSNVGDINGDDYDDVIIGTLGQHYHGFASGQSYLVYGDKNVTDFVELSELNGKNGIAIKGINSGYEGCSSVSSAGDFNGDGYGDILIGSYTSPSYENNEVYAGLTFLVYGGPDIGNNDSVFDLNSLNGLNGFIISGINANDWSGYAISGLGDVNGDGFDDIIIGAYGADPHGKLEAGESYVLFGHENTPPVSNHVLNLSSIDKHNGFVIFGSNEGDNIGFSVSGAGDFNKDGYDDILIGGYEKSFLVFGQKDIGKSGKFELNTLNGINGFIVNGVEEGDYAGASVGEAGDVNGDGFDDVIIGAFGSSVYNRSNVGTSYVIFGFESSSLSQNGVFELSLVDGVNGFALIGCKEGDWSGYSVDGAGDFNNDGYDDVIIGAFRAHPIVGVTESGQSYVVFGNENIGMTGSIDLTELSDGVVFNGHNDLEQSGFSVSGAGDFNHDGYDDIIIGAYGGVGGAGRSYIFYGFSNTESRPTNPIDPDPSPSASPTLSPTSIDQDLSPVATPTLSPSTIDQDPSPSASPTLSPTSIDQDLSPGTPPKLSPTTIYHNPSPSASPRLSPTTALFGDATTPHNSFFENNLNIFTLTVFIFTNLIGAFYFKKWYQSTQRNITTLSNTSKVLQHSEYGKMMTEDYDDDDDNGVLFHSSPEPREQISKTKKKYKQSKNPFVDSYAENEGDVGDENGLLV